MIAATGCSGCSPGNMTAPPRRVPIDFGNGLVTGGPTPGFVPPEIREMRAQAAASAPCAPCQRRARLLLAALLLYAVLS